MRLQDRAPRPTASSPGRVVTQLLESEVQTRRPGPQEGSNKLGRRGLESGVRRSGAGNTAEDTSIWKGFGEHAPSWVPLRSMASGDRELGWGPAEGRGRRPRTGAPGASRLDARGSAGHLRLRVLVGGGGKAGFLFRKRACDTAKPLRRRQHHSACCSRATFWVLWWPRRSPAPSVRGTGMCSHPWHYI